jgi:tetratricopeptide (TPR) repeat protein
VVAEFRGFYCMLQGDCRAAAGHYRRARGMGKLEPDQRDTLVFNEARMLKQAGDKAAALAVYADNHGSMQAKFQDQSHVEQADLLHDLGRDGEAADHLRPLLQHADEHPMATLQAGTLFEAMGRLPTADEAYSEAAKAVPVGNYHRARLKLLAGDTDRCLELLQLASDAAPAEVRRQIREDQSAWQALADDVRFRKLADSDAAASPGR